MLRRATILKEDRSWKGDIGRIGERFVIWARSETPPTVPGCHRVFGQSQIYLSADRLRVEKLRLGDLVTIFNYLPQEISDWRFRRAIRKSLAAAK